MIVAVFDAGGYTNGVWIKHPDCTRTNAGFRTQAGGKYVLLTMKTHRTTSKATNMLSTRKLSYCKDERVMRRIYGCPENFR